MMTDTTKEAVETLTQRSVEQNPYGATEAIENALYMLRALVAERDALQAEVAQLQEQCVEVMPLEWEEREDGHRARGYWISKNTKRGWCVLYRDDVLSWRVKSVEDGKEFAQGHLDRYILSAIKSRPASEVRREALDEAAEKAALFPEVKLKDSIPCDPSEAVTETAREIAAAIRALIKEGE